jgi:hypothetical protein
MSIERHIQALRAKHEQLELTLEQERSRPYPNDMLIADLKHQKLKIKDMIRALNRSSGA